LHLISDHAFKDIVQQILTGVESRLKQAVPVLLNWRLGRFFIEYLRDNITIFSGYEIINMALSGQSDAVAYF
jgi:hypothetical protein